VKSYIGRPVPRVEDERLLRGDGRYVDDITLPGMLHVAILGSPHAHARIRAVDVGEAATVPGVVRVFSGADIRAISEPLRGIPSGWTNHVLAVERVRYVGEPVAAVVAESRYAAEDGRDSIRVDYEPLPAVVDPEDAVTDRVVLHPARETNTLYHRRFTFGDVEGAFAAAGRVVRLECRWGRTSGNPIETGGCICRWDSHDELMTVWTNMQAANFLAPMVAAQLGLPAERVRIRRPDTGGSFGAKVTVWKYVALVGLLARQVHDRALKFVEDRVEHLRASSSHGPDRRYEAEAAVDAVGRVTALRVKCLDDLGAYSERRPGMAVKPLTGLSGCYEIPALEYDIRCVVTNKCPQGAYRGFGIHAHNFVVERLMDTVAGELGLDPVDVRLRNFIPPERFPYVLPTRMARYDSGDYPKLLRHLCDVAGYARLRAWQAQERGKGRLIGIGVATTVEIGGYFDNALYAALELGPAGPIPEQVRVGLAADGHVDVHVGYGSEGQGQDTIVAQLVAHVLQLDPEQVRVHHHDSGDVPNSFGTGGSRMAVALAGALSDALAGLRGQVLGHAGRLLDRSPAELELDEQRAVVRARPEIGVDLKRIASQASAPIEAQGTWPGPELRGEAFPLSYLTAACAAHLVVVEVLPTTGEVRFLDYHIADDCGTVLNPRIVDGMTQGAVAQGIGQALYEQYLYDEEGQLLSGSWMDYLVPTACEVPATKKSRIVTPSPYTAFGVKGTGESAMNTTPAAVANAVTDALKDVGFAANSLPIRPDAIWASVRPVGPRMSRRP
jgi:CO/xanthine dehydrogenase Mo-binding subunit